MNILQKITLAITIIGAINWGLVGIFDFNLVEWLFQPKTILTRAIYIIIAICGIINIALIFKRCHHTTLE